MKKIVVLGAGYAGLKTVVELQKKLKGQVEITLVDQNDYHYEATDLHEVASGNLPASKITFPISDVLNPQMTTLLLDRVTKVDPANCQVALANHAPLTYDYCVFALGFVSETFGIKGATANSLPMTNVDEAVAKSTLESCGFSVKTAIVMLVRGLSADEARRRLDENDGVIARALGEA